MANGTVRLNKEGIVVADIVFGMGLVIDSRGSQQRVNSAHIPFTSSESVAEALNSRFTKQEILNLAGGYAEINGASSEVFNVAPATSATHAVSKSQMELLFDTAVTEPEVLMVDGTSNILIPTTDAQPANKKYVDDTVINIGAGDMAKGIYDNNNNGIVDTTDAVGDPTAVPLGKSPANQVMRLAQETIQDANTIIDMGIYVGLNVANAPASGSILIEQFLLEGTKVQKCYAISTGLETTRRFNLTWTLWEVSDGSNRVRKSGDVMNGNLVIGNGVTGHKVSVRNTVNTNGTYEFLRQDGTLVGIMSVENVTGIMTFVSYDTLGNPTGHVRFTDGNIKPSALVPVDVSDLTRKDYVDSVVINKVNDFYYEEFTGSLDNILKDGHYTMAVKSSLQVPSDSMLGVLTVNSVTPTVIGKINYIQTWTTSDGTWSRRGEQGVWSPWAGAVYSANEVYGNETQKVKATVSCTQVAYDALELAGTLVEGVAYMIYDEATTTVTATRLTQPILCNTDSNFVGTGTTAIFPVLSVVEEATASFAIENVECKLTTLSFDMYVNIDDDTAKCTVTYEDGSVTEFFGGTTNHYNGNVQFESGVLRYEGAIVASGKPPITKLEAYGGVAVGTTEVYIYVYNFEKA